MKKMEFSIRIHASSKKVWDILIGKDTYPVWTSVFAEGSSAETDWKKGSKALFLDGNGHGMVSEIAESIPGKYLSIRHLGLYHENPADQPAGQDEAWKEFTENYTLKETNGITEWTVTMDMQEEYLDFMEKTWPQALEKVKELAENT